VVGAASVLTFLEFPSRYFDLIAGRSFPLTIVAIRDALLVVVVGLAVAEVWPGRRLPEAAARGPSSTPLAVRH
jgi:hypothetical protein